MPFGLVVTAAVDGPAWVAACRAWRKRSARRASILCMAWMCSLDTHVEELDLELPVSEVVDRGVFVVVFVVVGAGAIGCDEGVVR